MYADMTLHALIPFPNIDPVLIAFDIFGFELAIRWYALAYIAAFLIGMWWINKLVARVDLWKDNTPPMTRDQVDSLLTWIIIGTIIGGRLGYVFFYQPAEFLADPSRILRTWEGGMSFHGGFLGVIVAGWLFCWKNKLNPWSVGDTMAFAVPIGLFFGRMANFINAELWGRPTQVPWAVSFPTQAAQDCPIWWLETVCSRHPSQLYEAGLEGILLFAILAFLVFRKGLFKTAGAAIGVFFLGYGVARTIVEGFRQGDAQFTDLTNPWGHVIRFGQDVDSLGLSMGQILSIPMIIAGLAILIYTRTRNG